MDVKVDQKKVKELRLSKSWTQEQLADQASVSLRTIQRMELDGSASLKTRRAVADALGVEPGYLDPQVEQSFEEREISKNADSDIEGRGILHELLRYPAPSAISSKVLNALLVTFWILMIVTGSLVIVAVIPLALVYFLNPSVPLVQILLAMTPLLIIFLMSLGLVIFFKRLRSYSF